VIAGRHDAAQDVAHFRLIIDQAQQGVTEGAPLADTEDVFGSGIHTDNQQIVIQKNDARTQAVEDVIGFFMYGSIVTGAAFPRVWSAA
jgi:hypothetical protein